MNFVDTERGKQLNAFHRILHSSQHTAERLLACVMGLCLLRQCLPERRSGATVKPCPFSPPQSLRIPSTPIRDMYMVYIPTDICASLASFQFSTTDLVTGICGSLLFPALSLSVALSHHTDTTDTLRARCDSKSPGPPAKTRRPVARGWVLLCCPYCIPSSSHNLHMQAAPHEACTERSSCVVAVCCACSFPTIYTLNDSMQYANRAYPPHTLIPHGLMM